MPKKIRELKAMLLKAGFELMPKRGKGSHAIYQYPGTSGASRLKCWIDFLLVPPELGVRGLRAICATQQIKLDALLQLG